MFGYTVATPGF